MLINLLSFHEKDPNKKTKEWGSTIVSHLRMYMKPLVSPQRYHRNMRIILDDHDQTDLKKMFIDPENSGVTWSPTAIIEKVRNTLTAENENAGINVRLKAIDPTAANDRDRDRKLMANRKTIEGGLSSLATSIGMPPFSLANEKDEEGKPLFKGDVQSFDEMGLDDSNMEDLNYYFNYFHRLLYEIDGEQAMNFFIKENELVENIGLHINDIMAVKAIASRCYVNQVSGKIDSKYLCPANVFVAPNRRRDFKDAWAMMYEESVTVQEFIQMVGNEYNEETDLSLLLQAANTTNGTSYSTIFDGERYYVGGSKGEVCQYTDFLEFKVGLGYIEIKSNDAEAWKITKKNNHGNPMMYSTDLGRQTTSRSMYATETWYTENTYKCYFLRLSPTTQKLYKWGKLPYQMVEGAEDEYSSFSIVAYREKGLSIAEIAKVPISIVEKGIKKLEHTLAEAKLDGRSYEYNTLAKIAEKIWPDNNNVKWGIDQVISMFEVGKNELHLAPTTEEGDPVGGGGNPNFDILRTWYKSFSELRNTIDYGEQLFGRLIGFPDGRAGAAPEARDGYKLNMQALQASHNATQYIRTMLMSMYNNVGKRILSFIQDIIAFKNKSTLQYKYLERALGDNVMTNLERLNDVSFHRYGLFVEALSSDFERQQVMAITQQALAAKQIDYEQYLLVTSIRNPQKAIQVLAYEKKRKERVAQQQMAAEQQADERKQQMKDQHEYAMAELKANAELAGEKIRGQYYYLSSQNIANLGLQKEQLKLEGKADNIQQNVIADEQKRVNEANIEAQKPLAV